MRRILILSSALVFVDMLFFSILTPLLPTYVSKLGLSETEAGLLSSSYTWGAAIAALPAGFLAQNLGPRKVICWGLVALSATSLTYAWSNSVAVLDLARFAQGISGAVVWSGALTWLIGVVPEERKGAAIGTVTGVGNAGAFIGPAVGAIAVAIGPEWLFTAIPALLLVLCLAVSRSTDAHRFERQSVRTVVDLAFGRPLLNAFLFLSVPALGFGLMLVLVPLKMHTLGGSASLIAGAFIAPAVVELVLAPISGHWSDRVGRRIPYIVGLVLFSAGLAVMAATQSLAVTFIAPSLCSVGGGFWIVPAFALFSDVAEESELAQSHAFALSNTAFTLGLSAGGLLGGVIAGAIGTDAPFLALIAVLLVLAVYAARGRVLAPKSATTEPISGRLD
jgi:MFS family permease